jgi:uncharacterized membrane protein
MDSFSPFNLPTALATIHANQLIIISKLNIIINQERTMAVDFTKIQAEVTNNTTVEQSVVALLAQLTAIIKAIPPSNDAATQASLDQLTAALTANDTALSAAVTANTPAAPASGS